MATTLGNELAAFQSVCANEQYAHWRDMFPALGISLRALTSSLPFSRLAGRMLDTLPLEQKVRGAYLARLMRSKMAPDVKTFWDVWLSEHKDLRAPPSSALTFFHGDRDYEGPCLDDAALALGMRKGADLGKIMQLWKYGIAYKEKRLIRNRPYRDYKGHRFYVNQHSWSSSIYAVTPRRWCMLTNEAMTETEFHDWVDRNQLINFKVNMRCGRKKAPPRPID